MKLLSKDLVDGTVIADRFCFCVPDPDTHVTLGENLSPHLAWQEAPAGTRSFALVCVDGDAPTVGDDVNQEGREVPADLPRADFYHWALFNIPASVTELARGSHSEGVTPRGKAGPEAGAGQMHGLNDYTGWFAADADMAGEYYGYDGPCPPWNDARVHHYRFTVYALDCERLAQPEQLGCAAITAALQPHVLAQASLTVSYSLNPRLRR